MAAPNSNSHGALQKTEAPLQPKGAANIALWVWQCPVHICSPGPSTPQTQAIWVYTSWERHGLVGSEIKLYCSFFSWRWLSEDVSFSWSYKPEGAKDSISIFHYARGQAYVDNKGPFRDRLEFVGNPKRRDGSILIRGLEYNDNGTFTCDAKNPPDIVGRPSSVKLLVFDRGHIPASASPSYLDSIYPPFVSAVPTRAGVITGAIIGSVLGVVILILALYYLMRFLVARRVLSLSVSTVEKGKKKSGKEGSQQRQGPVLYATLDQSSKLLKGVGSDKKKSDSKRDKK
ncbi:MYP0 protein, partial [Polypterus senegalus]